MALDVPYADGGGEEGGGGMLDVNNSETQEKAGSVNV